MIYELFSGEFSLSLPLPLVSEETQIPTVRSRHTKGKVKVTQSCPTLCNPMDFTVHGILQARIMEWVAFPISRDLPNPRIKPRSPTLQADLGLIPGLGRSPGGIGYPLQYSGLENSMDCTVHGVTKSRKHKRLHCVYSFGSGLFSLHLWASIMLLPIAVVCSFSFLRSSLLYVYSWWTLSCFQF